MRKATKKDKDKVVEIIAKTFETNPGVIWMFKKGGDHNKYLKRLATYAFFKSVVRNGVFISSNEKGVALCYQYNCKKFSVTEIFYQLWFVFSSINLWFIPNVLKRESYRKKMRPESGEYLYFWFLGVLPGGNEAAFELKNTILEQAYHYKIPVYLETAVERNKKIYEKVGFKTYHYWEDKDQNIRFWFMKWEPDLHSVANTLETEID